MPPTVIVTEMPERFAPLATVLSEEIGTDILWANTAADALCKTRDNSPGLAVIDSEIGGENGLSLVCGMLAINAWLHTALVSSLSDEEFHHRSEGLGILVRLPPCPGKEAARRLVNALRSVGAVSV